MPAVELPRLRWGSIAPCGLCLTASVCLAGWLPSMRPGCRFEGIRAQIDGVKRDHVVSMHPPGSWSGGKQAFPVDTRSEVSVYPWITVAIQG